jgi:hypothetical protein
VEATGNIINRTTVVQYDSSWCCRLSVECQSNQGQTTQSKTKVPTLFLEEKNGDVLSITSTGIATVLQVVNLWCTYPLDDSENRYRYLQLPPKEPIMPFHEAKVHNLWDAHYDNTLELSAKKRLWLLVVFVAGSFLALGYVYWLVIQKEKEERKNK